MSCYISCHARPGELILEDAEGKEDGVSAERLWREALPAQRGVPLIVLAGCSTGRDAADDGRTGGAARAGAQAGQRAACPPCSRCRHRSATATPPT